MNLMHSTDPSTVFLGELGFAFGFALMGGAVVVNVELMPRIVRCTGLAFAYNLAVGVFGGTTPLVCTTLIQSTGDPTSPAWWIAGAAAITLVTTILWVPETRDRALD